VSLWAAALAALGYIKLKDLPDIITMHQACRIETNEEQAALVSEITRQLRE
jgi:hypothetical protein